MYKQIQEKHSKNYKKWLDITLFSIYITFSSALHMYKQSQKKQVKIQEMIGHNWLIFKII